jgi:hypothetical protein
MKKKKNMKLKNYGKSYNNILAVIALAQSESVSYSPACMQKKIIIIRDYFIDCCYKSLLGERS